MAISGGIKFFNKSQCLAKDGALIAAGTGNDAAPYALDLNPDTKWRSVGSNDITTETIQVNLPATTTISRLFIVDHNWKDFSIKYDTGSGLFQHFSGVTGLDGSKANITETAFADDTAYYEVTPVSVSKLQITVNKTQTANQEKYCSQIVATNELGTLQGYPQIKDVEADRNMRVTKTISGKKIVQKSIETFNFDLKLKNYPSETTYSVDMDVLMALHDLEDPFLVWLCGGTRGSTYFRYTLRGFRLKDLLQMQLTKAVPSGYVDTIYVGGINSSFSFEEHV